MENRTEVVRFLLEMILSTFKLQLMERREEKGHKL